MKYRKAYLLTLILFSIFSIAIPEAYGQGKLTRKKTETTSTNKTKKTEPVKKNTPIKISDPTGYLEGHGYVDLGLSVKWATCNIGSDSPEDYGYYYAWGETAPKESYEEKNSFTLNKSKDDLEGVVTSDGRLTEKYDAATVNFGKGWRMPTDAEWEELIRNCQWQHITYKGVKGLKVTAPNGKNIFLPFTGYYSHSTPRLEGTSGEYWSSTIPLYYNNKTNAHHFFNDSDPRRDHIPRYLGLAIRPVTK